MTADWPVMRRSWINDTWRRRFEPLLWMGYSVRTRSHPTLEAVPAAPAAPLAVAAVGVEPAPAASAPLARALPAEAPALQTAAPAPVPQGERLGVPAAGWAPPGTAPKTKSP